MTTETAPEQTLSSVAGGDAPVLESLVAMNLDSFENSGLDPKAYFLVRLAALVAIDAPPMSYLMHLSMAGDAGVTLEDAQGMLIAIAPVVGTPRIVAAAGNVLRAFGIANAAGDIPDQG